jgi:hypothetical protein
VHFVEDWGRFTALKGLASNEGQMYMMPRHDRPDPPFRTKQRGQSMAWQPAWCECLASARRVRVRHLAFGMVWVFCFVDVAIGRIPSAALGSGSGGGACTMQLSQKDLAPVFTSCRYGLGR